MADIKLVVKLDEADYINIKNAISSLIENGVDRASMSKVCLAILDGKPLPKGHWINKHRFFDSSCSAECSVCHKRSSGYMHDNGFTLVSTYYDFCPKCGSDNREVEEE